MVSKLGLSESLAIAGEKRAVSAAELFDALSSARTTQLRQKASQLFEIVALPSTPLQQELRKGDLIVRRGDNDRGHIAVVARPALLSLKTLLSEGILPESLRDGNYTEVVETGARPHTSSDHFARQLTDSAGRLLNDILLLRLATPPTVVQVQQPTKTGDEPDVASEDVELCASDISEFGRSWRASHDMRRNPRPQTQGGKPLCRGQNDLKSHGLNSSTVDLLLFNFDIDGSYPKIQHEKALANLISAIHDNIMSNPRADQNATAYEVFLQGYADRTGSARYNELLANDREAAVESYLRANIDRFTKIPELPIGPLIRYNRMTGGFAPDALPGKNTAHARAVLVWAVPTGGVKPPPRPVPKPSTAFDELTDLVRPVSMGLTADKAKVLAPLATAGAVFTKTMSFPDGWNAILVVNAGGTAASMVEFPVSMVHGGTTHVMPAVVFQSLSWKKLAISDKSFTGGAEIALPLTNRFILAVADASGTLKTISGGASDIFPIETDIQTYATVVFGYLVDGQTGNIEALDISQAPSGQLRGFLNNHGQSAEASSSKAAVLVTCELSLTGPKDDFQPKGPSPIGPANVVRTYPLLSVWSSRPLSSVNGSLDMIRPSRSPMDDMAAGGLISNGFYTDVNGTVLSLWDCLSSVWKRVLTFTPVLPGVPASAGPAVVAAMRSVPCTRWDSIFAHYKLDANVSNVTVVAPGLPRRTNTSARQVWDLSTSAYRTSAAPVVKVERQGMFDNVHVAPAMDYQRVAAFMAPLCHHDCLHIHWRWGEQYTDQPLRGWSGGKPYRKSGAPMIPENQTLRISAHGPSVTYMPMAQYVPAQSWQIFMHHGTGYVSALTFLGATAPLLELAQLSPNLPDFAPFYYHNRMHEIGGASRAADRSRLNESSFGPLESM
jgi:outer membrane protein OmpA-like peptidoglycan-associated protein